MKCRAEDRWLLPRLGVVLIFCACQGCQTFDATSKHQWMNHTKASISAPVSDEETISKSGKSRRDSQVKPASASGDPVPEPPEMTPLPLDETPTVKDDRFKEDVLSLSVSEAISSALTNNLHLRVVATQPEEVGKQAEIERSEYDMSFNANLQYLQGTQQVASALQAVKGGQREFGLTTFGPVAGNPNLVSLEQRFSSGTFARIGVGSNYNYTSPIGQYLIYNPAFQSAGSLVVEQALFRGASRQANLTAIHLAETNQKQTAAEFQVEINQTLSEVQRAYWTAWLAESHLKTSEDFVEQAQTTHHLEKVRFEIGEGGIVQVAQATEHLHSLKADLSQAKQRARAARNHLLSLIGASPSDRRPLKMTGKPISQPVLPDLDQGIALATEQRPEIRVRQFQVAQAQLELDRRRNNLSPDVRAYAGYSLTGLNNNIGGSFSEFASAHYGTASLGVRYSYMIGQRADRAALEQARLVYMRQVRAREESEFLIRQEVRDAWDSVNSAWEVYQCQQERVSAARVQTETFTQLHAAGQIDLDRLLRSRQQLSNALQQSQIALVDYNLALNGWQFATGTMTVPLMPTEVPPPPSANKSSNVVTAGLREETSKQSMK